MQVHCITRDEEFAGLETEWNDLLRRSAADNPFLTHQWLHSWWRTFGRNSRLHILVCRERSDAHGPLLGVFPGYVAFGRFPPVRRLRLLGSEVVTSDFLDVIVDRDRENEVLSTLLKALRHDKGFHIVELTDLREGSPLLTSWDCRADNGLGQQEWPSQKICPFAPLPQDPSEYFSGLRRTVRKNFQYYRRRLEAQGASLDIVLKEEDLAQGMADFSRLHRSRRNQKGESGVFASKAQNDFYSDVFKRFFRAGWFELAFLKVAEQRVAGVCQFNYGDIVYYYQTGYDVTWEKSSVGFVLNGLLMERAIRQGKSCFEFLRGEEAYKYRMGATHQRVLKDVYLTKGSVAGEMLLACRRLSGAGRACAKAFLRSAFGVRRPDGKSSA